MTNLSSSANSSLVRIGKDITVGRDHPLLLIAGPCQIESLDHCLKIAEFLQKNLKHLPVNLVFKSSFDKANRTSATSGRGPGIESGLKILAQLRQKTGLPVLTDVHTAEQAVVAAEVVDVLQTPAFLCRQTDLLLAVGKTGKPVNIKKGQFLPPQDMKFAAEKIASTGNKSIMMCERGSSFGYRDLIVDMRSLVVMGSLGYPVIFDATHSVQSMGGSGGSSGGNREFVAPLVRAAVATGVDGLFIECHDNPDKAPSDGPSMVLLDQMPGLIEMACRIREAASAHDRN